MSTEVQTVAGAGQFTGLPGAGQFAWARLDRMARTAQVCVARIAYRQQAGNLNYIRGLYIFPGTSITLFHLTGSQIADPLGGFSLNIGGGLVPRQRFGSPGVNWVLIVVTDGKNEDGDVIVDWHVDPLPERVPNVRSANTPGS